MENEQTIILQPEYVKTFQCDGNKCNAKCCKDDWRIDIDIETYKKYQRIKNRLFRGNGGCFSSAIPVFMLIKWPLIFGWEV